jgi:hypothetical protein
MPAPRRGDEDVRPQHLADLSIEIRTLSARVQAVMDERAHGDAADSTPEHASAARQTLNTTIDTMRCPHCGHTAGLALLPREYRRLSTLVRCFSCGRDAVAVDWAAPTPPALRSAPQTLGDGIANKTARKR